MPRVSFSIKHAKTAYLLSAAVIFTFAAGLKLTASYSPEEMILKDPFVAFISVKQMITLSALVEGIVATIILLNLQKNPNVGLWMTLWLSSIFFVYRIGMRLSPEGAAKMCKCFGGPGGILGKRSDLVAQILLGYLLLIGFLFLLTSSSSLRNLVVSKRSR